MERIILASGSAARKYLMDQLGLAYDAIPADVDEDNHPERDPPKRVRDLARMKAQKVAAEHPGAWVIGSDSVIVAHDGTLLEKPRDMVHAEEMLRLQSGNWSTDHAAICLIAPDGTAYEGAESGRVLFGDLSDDMIRWWVDSGIWKGKSGGFHIEGTGQLLLKKLDGNHTSVMGFPVWVLGELFEKAGRPLHTFIKP